MVFSSYTFLILFFPLLLMVYYGVPARFRQLRNGVLLVFSLVFYSCGGVYYLGLMAASILINWAGGLLVAGKKHRRLFMVLAAVLNLGLLGWFKYAGFFGQMLHHLWGVIPVPQVVLPIGISFFTFQGLSYVIDVYRDPALCQKSLLKVALYVSLFPQLVAGPIVRYPDVAAEIDRNRENGTDFIQGLIRFSFGLGKKMLLANPFGEVADGLFGTDFSILSVGAAWVGIVAYALQIYFDFSAYSDMAIGLGRVFGFHFLENFNYPYISRTITEFWRRWHISLSGWFRDYVYIPLGGSRVCLWKQVRNLLVVWLLTGFWHGAAWNFVMWGGWYGLLLLGEKFVWKKWAQKAPAPLGWAATMLAVLVGWVFFRSADLGSALSYIKVMLGVGAPLGSGQAVYYLLEYWPEWVLGLVACLPVKPWLEQKLSPQNPVRVWGVRLLALVLLVLSFMKITTGTFNPFLYFRF